MYIVVDCSWDDLILVMCKFVMFRPTCYYQADRMHRAGSDEQKHACVVFSHCMLVFVSYSLESNGFALLHTPLPLTSCFEQEHVLLLSKSDVLFVNKSNVLRGATSPRTCDAWVGYME